MSEVVEREVSARRQDTSGIAGQHHARLIAHSQAFESRLQIRDRWKLVQRVLVLFDQFVEPDKTRARYVSGIELPSIAADVQDNQVAVIQVLLQP